MQAELEKARQEKVIGQSLDAQVLLRFDVSHSWANFLKKYEKFLPEFFIVSAVHLVSDSSKEFFISVKHADGVRCPRTWRWVDKLVEIEGFGKVSERCAEVLQFWKSNL